MRRTAAVLGVLAGLGSLSACTPDSTGPADRPLLATSTAGTLVCDFAELKKAARAYFASNQDPIFTIISNFEKQYRQTGPSAATTDYALDGWARLAAARLTSAQKSGSTGAHGNAVALGLGACGDAAFVAALTGIDFTSSLDPSGLFEVRGDDTQDPPTAPAYSRGGTNVWVTHPVAGNTWGQTFGQRVAIYGYVTSLTSVDDVVVAEAFQFSTAPSISTLLPVVRGICGFSGNTYRIQRNQNLIPDSDVDCSGAVSSSVSSGGPLMTLARHIASVFLPQALEAAATGTAGSIHDYSPHLAVDLQFVTMSFVSQPLDGFVNQPIAGSGSSGVVEVLVETANGRPLPGVPVTLTVAGNEGTNVVLSNATATTDANGIASFTSLSLNKAGGYTLWANGAYDGIPGQMATSVLFNIKNQ